MAEPTFFQQLMTILGDVIIWVLGGMLGLVSVVTNDYKTTRHTVKENERILMGNDDNPNNDGVVEIVADNNQRLKKVESNMDELKDGIEEIRENIVDE